MRDCVPTPWSYLISGMWVLIGRNLCRTARHIADSEDAIAPLVRGSRVWMHECVSTHINERLG